MIQADIKDYDFIDFGCSQGDSISHAMEKFGAKRGIGIDIDPVKVQVARGKGHHVILGDITKMDDYEKSVNFVTLIHFLEHLDSYFMAEKCIHSAINLARDFVYIKQPFFDTDSYLFYKGFKNYWADWRGHSYHMTSFDIYRILMKLQLKNKICRFVIYGLRQTKSSADSHIHPLQSPIDQHHYDTNKHPHKVNNVLFDEVDVFKELDVFIDISNKNCIDKYIHKIGRDGKKIFDSVSNLPFISKNIRTIESGHVGELTTGREILQKIKIPEDICDDKKLVIEILMATFNRENYGSIEYSLKQGSLLEKVVINTIEIQNNKYQKILFNKYHFKAGTALFKIKCLDGAHGNSVTAYLTKDAPWGGASIDNNIKDESLVMVICVSQRF